MKHLKLYESKEDSEILRIIKITFIELWGEKINMSNININQDRRKPGKYRLSSDYSMIDEKNYQFFIIILNFLGESDVTFRFVNNRIHIYINDLYNFANRLEMLKTSKKYNL